jgi:glycosyltransferase involved in cell wall biosynthesis
MESLSCGTPVAGFKIGGVQEMIDDGQNGFVGLPDNLEQLAVRIADFIESGNRISYSRNARNKALTCFDANVVVGQHFDYYQK